MKESTRVLIALGTALGAGAAVAASGNPRLVHATEVIAPVGVLWINAIRMTVIPLVVSLLVTGVAGAADLRAIGRIGGRTLLTFPWCSPCSRAARRDRPCPPGRRRRRESSPRAGRPRTSGPGSPRSSPPIRSPPRPTARCCRWCSSPCCWRSPSRGAGAPPATRCSDSSARSPRRCW
ncbi:MAG: hypothetical protein DMD43_06010 [Gemmatimonadetes bacterium]|nr:MAG: hypothetical protein DMD43_06010 [Gemmatimonadota bacterium]